MKTLFEFEDGEDLYMEQVQWFMGDQKIILKPRTTHRTQQKVLNEILAEWKQGKYPKLGYLLGIYKDEDGGQWLHVSFPQLSQERLLKSEYWAWY